MLTHSSLRYCAGGDTGRHLFSRVLYRWATEDLPRVNELSARRSSHGVKVCAAGSVRISYTYQKYANDAVMYTEVTTKHRWA